ncbi:hypothetical protein BGW80DRAFT_867955 [Lactifluus volemus]|nr:hypothetical protein BGW80DRAFT_867955 [Lactifluus volemus]
MVDWNSPLVLQKDYLALIKINHAVAGIYIWEVVTTFRFELDILRGKRPFKWTIWLYLLMRYTALIVIILFLASADGAKISCGPFTMGSYVLAFISWGCASLIIVLRVIAIWNREKIPTFLAIALWLVGNALNIYTAVVVKGFSPIPGSCVILGLRKSLASAIGTTVIDLVLLMCMLIGLLRFVHNGARGIWHVLYQQCIIWIALACIAEVPIPIFLALNWNAAWGEMFALAAVAALYIGAGRLYRELSIQGSFTADVTYESATSSRRRRTFDGVTKKTPLNFAAITQSSATATTGTSDPLGYLPKDQMELESKFPHGASNHTLVHQNKIGYDEETNVSG